MKPSRSIEWLPLGLLWLALVAGSLYLRPSWPVDETRYLAVAWEMWVRGDFLVPYLNGVPYSHKPPLLFWLFHLGWAVFGVNEWWPRLVPPLLALASVALTVRLARRLWPERPDYAATAGWVLFGSLFWLAFMTLTMFDLLVACFTLLAMSGLQQAWQKRTPSGFALLGIAIGLGLLAKGPAFLVPVLPVAFAARWWMAPRRPGPAWHGGVALAFAGGVLLVLAWAVPAALVGGGEYASAIFWSQTAGRVTAAFAHPRPWWWYLPLLPLMLFPWFLWPPWWRGLQRLAVDARVRFVFAWLVPALVIFSFISGKQPHYLLPLFPAFALLAAAALHNAGDDARWYDGLPPALAAIGVAAAWLLLPLERASMREAALPAWPAFAFMFVAVLLAVRIEDDLRRRIRLYAGATVVMVAAVYGSLVQTLERAYDLRPIGARLAALDRSNVPIAHVGKYHGQFHFFGRLHRPLDVIEPNELAAWMQQHPEGRVVTYEDPTELLRDASPGARQRFVLTPEYVQPYRGGNVYVWNRMDIHARADRGGTRVP